MAKKNHENKAIRTKAGWIWYDFIGRDFGPYDTKKQAEVLGKQASANEERLMKGRSKQSDYWLFSDVWH